MDGNYDRDEYGFVLPDDEVLSEDVDSMDVHSRTEESLTSDLHFQDQLQNAIITPTPSSRKRTKKVPSAGQRYQPNVDPRSRARPKKPHEPAPFLSIDNLPTERRHQSQGLSRQGQTLTGSSKTGVKPPINTPSPQLGGRTNSSQLRSASSATWNSMVPKKHSRVNSAVKRGTPPNHHVKAPFKHNVNNGPISKTNVSPDQALKEQTAQATLTVARTMAKQKPTQEQLVKGRLLKAKLKPLGVVRVEGPAMNKCRGIVAETRSHDASPSKTLQRRRQILNTIASDNMYERPQTMESMHRTSIASDLTEDRDRELKDDLERAEADILDTAMGETSSRVRDPPNTIATYSNPNSRFTAASMVNVGAAPSEYQPTPTRGHRPEEEEEDGAVVGELNHQQPTPEAAPTPQGPKEVVPVPADPAESQENNKLEASNSPSETVATPVDETSSAEKLLDTQFVEQANRKRSANSSIPAEEFEMSLNQVERQNRPRSVQDPNQRKEVRFADTQEGSDPVRRSYSALPRLSNDDESKENRDDNGVSCKDESTNIYTRRRGEDDDDDDLAGGDNPGRGTGRGTGSQNAGSAQGSTSPTKQGQSQGENNSNKGNGGKQQALKMANSTLNQGFEDPEAGERKRSPMRRPRSQLGTWEDVLKPDNNPCALSIEGVRQSWSDAAFDQYQQSSESNNVRKKYNGEEPVNSATIAYNRKSRPRSAKGPKDYKAEEEEKAARKLRRPQSASSYKIISTDESVMMGLARMNTRDSKPAVKERSYNVSVTEGAATVLKRNQLASTTEVRRRPASAQVVSAAGIRRRPTSAHGARTTTAKARRPKSAVPSNREARSKSNCTYCGKSATKTINYHHGIFFSVCNTCSQQSQGMQQASDMCNSNETSVEQTAGSNEPELEDEVVMPVEREEEIVGMTHIEGFVDHSQNNRSGEKSADARSPLNEGQMLTNLDDLDKSLSLVQQEIRNCIQQTSMRIEREQVPEASGSVRVIPSPDVMAEGNGVGANSESSESECTQAEFSQALTDADVPKSGFAYRMTVFQFSDETSQTTEEKPAEVGDISSYEVTMMNEADGQSVKAEKEAEGMALLNTLCQQLKNSEMMGGGEKSVKAPLDTSPLQVIATSKTMSQPKTSCGAANPIAPVAPLCFRVNARPPRGSLYYFAYGMDMNPHRFSNYIGRSTEERFWGLLYGFRLAFNKKGLDTEAGGFPNILFDQASAVEGCLYLVSPEEINVLDKCMGYPGHFEHVMLPVWLLNCNDPSGLGVAQYCVPALMYIAKDEWIHTGPDALDNSYALDQCLKGANILSDSYKDNMAAMRQFTTRSS